jgi:hypothetical protein
MQLSEDETTTQAESTESAESDVPESEVPEVETAAEQPQEPDVPVAPEN